MAWNGENPGSNPVRDANRINNLTDSGKPRAPSSIATPHPAARARKRTPPGIASDTLRR